MRPTGLSSDSMSDELGRHRGSHIKTSGRLFTNRPLAMIVLPISLSGHRVCAPVRPLRAAGVRYLRQAGAVDVDDVDLAIGVEVEAAGERDLRPVRRPGGIQAPYGSGVGVRSAAAGA